jgi:hypothetical protein
MNFTVVHPEFQRQRLSVRTSERLHAATQAGFRHEVSHRGVQGHWIRKVLTGAVADQLIAWIPILSWPSFRRVVFWGRQVRLCTQDEAQSPHPQHD